MKIEEGFQVPSSVEKTWDFITDSTKMASCFPSVQSVKVIDDRHYEVTVKQSVGFISATFRIQTEILEKEAPCRMVLANKGKTIAGANGLLKSTETITLRSIDNNCTEVRVVSDLTLGGQLAVLGAKLIEAKSKEIFAEVTANLREKLGGAPAAPRVEGGGLIRFLRSLVRRLRGLFFGEKAEVI
jgi:carbon monoxide dehydrogenase subunit G